MFEALQAFDLSVIEWILVALSAMMVGMAKTGVAGLGMLIVVILATIFGGKVSTGILLPMLCMGDIFGVTYYNRHAEWKHVWRLLPWALAGLGIGLYVGEIVSDELFKSIMGVIIISGIGLMIWQEQREVINVPDYWWFSALMGLGGGFATMIGNAAGPIMALYLLSMRLPKNSYIGTAAWFFLIINYLKLPLHIFVWETITWQTVSLDFAMLPMIAVGALVGIKLVKLIPDRIYRYFIMAITTFAGFMLFF
jgi:hypothetical protein